ncbi:hypothetical protein F4Z99_11535 [Candidatus Poribacteria bacterium]|nr:hypothetical protein [Candidatus Poribacteria bacterium]
MPNIERKPRIGLHHYPTVENENYLSGTVDLYYGWRQYNDLRSDWLINKNEDAMHEMDTHFNRVQYVIFKEDGTPTEMILLENGLPLDWDTEIENGLDCMYVSHLWPAPHNLETAYRFACHRLEPIGRVWWTAPDLFNWHKDRAEPQETP